MNYERLAETALRLIATTGRVVIFERLEGEALDPGKPWKGAQEQIASATLSQAATFVPASGDGLGKELVSNAMLARAEKICLVGSSAVFDLNSCNSIVDDGVKWGVEWVHELKPATVSLLFAIGVSR